MNGNIQARGRLMVIESFGNLCDRLVRAGVRNAHNRHDSDGVLVDVVRDCGPVQGWMFLGNGDVSRLNIPVVAKLLPDHLNA